MTINYVRAIDLEEAYWRSHYPTRPYVCYGAKLDDYLPAYRYGIDAAVQFPGRAFSDLDEVLSRNWYRNRGRSSLKWEKAKLAAIESWTRMNGVIAALTAAEATEAVEAAKAAEATKPMPASSRP